ncbi:hypothetical protein Ancab_010845 [Ancistrocladus abbreviatus]
MEPQEKNISVSVIWRGKKFVVEINSGATLKELGDELQKLTNVKAETMRMIVPKSPDKSSKLLAPFSDDHSYLKLHDTSILEGKSIRMMGVSENEVEEVQKGAKASLRIAGFEEEEKRMRMRMSNRPRASLKLPQGPYVFCEFRTLELPGIELNPRASEALKRMHMLAADPGIVAIMNKHRWRVGIMTEMAPVGYVGISPKCILGFNKNHGEEISLRLRTDDLKGFRKYESIKKTLLHELAHMVYSEHDADFYALDKQLNEEASSLDWTRSRSYRLGEVRSFEQSDMDVNFEPESTLSHMLGGKRSDMPTSARAASVAAAHHRLASAHHRLASAHQEPDPDDPMFGFHGEGDRMGIVVEGEMVIQNESQQLKDDCEPDPDDCLGKKIKLEPDPDDLQGPEGMESKPYHVHKGRTKAEPDPDDSDMTELMHSFTTNGMLYEKEIYEEPDPDDSEVPWNCGSVDEQHGVESRLAQTETDTGRIIKNSNEPDPDELETETSNLGNSTLPGKKHRSMTDSMGDPKNGNICVKMDLDDSGANRVIEAEPDPDETLDDLLEIPRMKTSELDPDDEELERIQDPVAAFHSRLTKAIEMLQAEVGSKEAGVVLQTLFKIIRNVIEHPDELKYKRLRKANPVFQKSVARYKAAMEVLFMIGFCEDVIIDEIGMSETYVVLKRDDPGLLWLAKSSLETCIA